MAAMPVSRRRLSLTCLALALPLALGCGTPAQALDHSDGRWLRVEIVDRASGRTLPVLRHDGELFVAGAPGARYAVRLTNRSGERLLAVVAVDGVNIVSGETASAGQRGYVLSPWGHAWLTGWRKSEHDVATFEFTALADSYAARTGRPGDVGVIGVAIFRERPQAVAMQVQTPENRTAEGGRAAPEPASRPGDVGTSPPSTDARSSPAQPAPAAADQGAHDRAVREEGREMRAAAGERLGTGHGAREVSEAETVAFERASRSPQETLRIRYDSLENLAAAGVVPRPLAWAGRPRPFPADDGFVPDPPNP